jgi:methylmalonyl-CoA mutase N-terminal domain/subunit
VQNDVLKEYVARCTYIFPPGPSVRIATDIMAYCRDRLPRWNSISISGYHMREAGCTAAQEIAFTFANAIAYVTAAVESGLPVDELGSRLSFFFACHMNLFEEVAKFRAARRMWARLMNERFGATDPRAMMLRFHTQTGGATLTAQQPENNIVRTAYEALAAVLGGTQSLHTNSFDEALALPTERAARLALRTQHVLAYETGVADSADPLGGSWLVEWLTDKLEEAAGAILARIDATGGAIAAIESGWIKREIEESAYRMQQAIEDGRRPVVGVNRYAEEGAETPEVSKRDPASAAGQLARLARVRAERDAGAVTRGLRALQAAARDGDNLLYPMRVALGAYATLGEVCDVLRNELGTYATPDRY